jgi:hypothetical protein
MLFKILLLASACGLAVGMVDLFQHKVSAFRNGAIESLGCESLILETFKRLNGTGVKVRHVGGQCYDF